MGRRRSEEKRTESTQRAQRRDAQSSQRLPENLEEGVSGRDWDVGVKY